MRMLVRGSPVSKHDEEDNCDHHADWYDKEVRKQLELGVRTEAAGQGQRGEEESRVGLAEETFEEIGLGKKQIACKAMGSTIGTGDRPS